MIRGYFSLEPNAQAEPHDPPNLPIWCAYPWFDVVIRIPSLGVDSTFTMMADTGATSSALNVKDAVPALGKRGYRLLRKRGRRGEATGIGGTSPYINIAAKIILQHEDGTLEGFDFDLCIAKPARKGSEKLRRQLELPSLLGRDILCHFRTVMDFSSNQLFLDHN